METVFRSFTGSLNHELSGSKLKTSNRIGAAAFTPIIPGRPSPVALPTQTLTTYSGVTPIAQASLNPKDVPVYQATLRELLNTFQLESSIVRITSNID